MAGDLLALPKANLHLHLTGSMRPATAAELAARYGLPGLPAVPIEDGVVHTWAAFQARYDVARSAVRSAADVARVVREAVEQDAEDGAGWTELQIDPTAYAEHLGGLEAVVDAALDAAAGLPLGVVLAAAWGSPPAHADRIAAIAVRRAPDGVVGFGLSGDERRGTTADYVPAFRRVRDAGLAAVPHAGFYHGAWHVREVVELLGATRVGHGLTALEDPAVVDLLAERGVTLEVCPTSYPPFGGPAPGELPLRALADAGVPVALATDDPLLFRTGLVGQYALVREHLELSDAELARLATGSIRASCAPPALRERALAGVRDWLDSKPR